MPGFPFPTKQEMDHPMDMRWENRGFCVMVGPSVFLSSGNGNVGGDFLSCLNVIKDPSKAQDGRWDSLSRPLRKRASSCMKENLWFSHSAAKLRFHLSYDGDLRDPLSGATGNSNLHTSCKGTSGFLKVATRPKSSSEVESGTLWFISSAHMDLGVPLEFTQVRPRLEWRHATQLSSRLEKQWLRLPVG